jgi:hypothetical protein
VNEDLSPEDRTILTALAALERGSGVPIAPGEESEAAETLARLYTEVLGLVPYELEPAAPRPEVKARLLAAVRGEAAPEVEDDTLPQPPPPKPRPAPPAVSRPAPAALREMPAAPRVAPAAPRVAMVPRRRSVWPLALAASLIVVLGGLCGWLLMRQTRMEATLADLERELAAARQEAEQALARAQEMDGATERMRVNFALVTAPAVKVMPLRPVGQSQARGILFVAADNQHWYLAVHDLPPAAPGRDYQLWWVAEQGTSSGGNFDTRAGEKVELFSATMPEGTRDVKITLEPAGGVRAPTGPDVLRAAGVYQL